MKPPKYIATARALVKVARASKVKPKPQKTSLRFGMMRKKVEK